MERPITGFRTDEHGDWVAILGCGHPQHVRHRPPFTLRPWVTTPEGRASRLGHALDCVRCDAFELPEHLVRYKKTPIFTEESVPDALRANHATKPGVWGKIVVVQGVLRYHVDGLNVTMELSPERPSIVVPEVPHQVEPVGAVRFFVEFYRSPDLAGS